MYTWLSSRETLGMEKPITRARDKADDLVGADYGVAAGPAYNVPHREEHHER